MLILNSESQNNQERNRTVKARELMLEERYKKRRKMGT